MAHVEPLAFPPDAVLLKDARLRWLEDQNTRARDQCEQLADALVDRIQAVQLDEMPDQVLQRIQDVISGAVNLREQWTRHLSAMKALQALAEDGRTA